MNSARHVLTFLLLLAAVAGNAQNYVWVNHQTHDFPYNPDMTTVNSASDEWGNSYLTLIKRYVVSYGGFYYGDYDLKRYSSQGALTLTKNLTGKCMIEAVESGEAGSIFISGSFMDTMTVDSSYKLLNTGTGLNRNYFIIKLSADGEVIWAKNLNAIYGNDIRIDAICARPSVLYASLVTFSTSRIIRFNSAGNEELSVSLSGARTISSIDAGPDGDIFAGGSCGAGVLQLGDTAVNAPFTYNDYFVRFSASGECIYVNFVRDITFQRVNVVSDDQGNLFASGDLFTNVQFGQFQTSGPQWVYDFYLVKIDPDGNYLWVREVPNVTGTATGDARKAKNNSLALDSAGNIFLSGMLRGSVSWGNISTTSSGSNDVLILKYSSAGELLYGKTAGGSSSDRADDISYNSGMIFVSGNFSGSAQFDQISANGAGNKNSFLALMNDAAPVGLNLCVIPEGFYNMNSGSLNMSDTVTVILRQQVSPYAVKSQSKGIIDRFTFTGVFTFPEAPPGFYYLQVLHRNSIETWSFAPQSLGWGQNNFDFTASAGQAFGSNQVLLRQLPARYGIYAGDVNMDGLVDLSDVSRTDNDAAAFAGGYVPTDLNGDGFVDLGDVALADNNAYRFVTVFRPR